MPPVSISPNFSTPLQKPLRSDINNALLTSGGIDRIHNELLLSLQASGWAEAIRHSALEQIRENGKTTYKQILEQVMQEIRGANDDVRSKGKKIALNGRENAKLKVPETVVDEGLSVVRRELEQVVEIVDA